MPAISESPDAMSDVLSLVRMRGKVVCLNEFSAPWAYSFRHPAAHFHIVDQGSAWLTLPAHSPTRLNAGDLVILPSGAGHTISSSPGRRAIPIERAMAEHKAGTVMGGGGDPTSMVSGQFAFEGFHSSRLLTVLPPLIHIQARQGRPLEWLRLTSHFLIEETRLRRPGSNVMIARLLDLLFIQALREWGGRSQQNMGWLGGLRDEQIGRAISAIHDKPEQAWTVKTLASIAGMSRSTFATRFLNVVGQTPQKYLTSWRLALAAEYLRSGSSRVGAIAASVGYGSEAALTRAFSSQFGTTPGAFRKLHRQMQAISEGERLPVRGD